MPNLSHVNAAATLALGCILSAVLARDGCQNNGPETEIAATPLSAPASSVEGNRFIVRVEQVVADSLAYHGKRGVYVIVDTITGREYLGVSGVGISELGAHSTTTVVPDGGGGMRNTHKTVKDER